MFDVAQGTDEWMRARMGKVTASAISNCVMAKTTAGWQNYQAQLICERLTGQPTETFKSAAMDRGNELEPQARAFYELESGNTVEEVGFIQHPKIEGAGCSPDGLIGLDGGLELKCPGQAKHIKNLMGGTIDKGYMLQMQWSMECTGREWWDFGSFNPDFPDHLKISIRRVERNAEVCEELKAATTTFLEEMESKLLVLEGMAA